MEGTITDFLEAYLTINFTFFFKYQCNVCLRFYAILPGVQRNNKYRTAIFRINNNFFMGIILTSLFRYDNRLNSELKKKSSKHLI